jgi:pyruvate/2-oxoglutarate dehydrogenase complex dihydrolipoamide dehydrogenase (E3) component
VGAAVLGGTCLNDGCIPSKALLHASELFDLARNCAGPNARRPDFRRHVSAAHALPTMQQAADAAAIMR